MELAARSRVILRRSIGSPVLFTIIYTSLASAVYFALGVIAGHALGLTPIVFLFAAVFFALTRAGTECVLVFFVLSGFLVGGKVIEIGRAHV